MPLTAKTVTVYHGPTSTRGYRSKASAYNRWAKDLIVGKCACEPEVGFTCGMHRRVFRKPMWACASCGTPDSEVEGASCQTCCRGSLCTVRVEIEDSTRYQVIKKRLARWLRWRDRATQGKATP